MPHPANSTKPLTLRDWSRSRSCDALIREASSWEEFRRSLNALGLYGEANKRKGDVFERFVQLFLRYQPEYEQQLEEIWLHDELPFEIKQELNILTERGIDLIAKTREGEYWAIQAKYRANPEGSIPLGDLGTFGTQLAVVTRSFVRGVICATKREKTPDFARAKFPVEQVLLDTWESIEAETWDRIRQAAAGEEVEPLKPFEPRLYQAAAISAAKTHFMKEGNRRGKLIMPCGTGKSLMGYWTAVNALKAKTIVVAVPSLDLIRQTFAVWAREAVANQKSLDVLIVCSDRSTVEGDTHVDDLAAPATTDPDEIKYWLKYPQRKSDMRVVFVTYQSGKVFADEAGSFQFDVALYDEAHKTAGYEGKRNQHLLHQKNLNVRHRVFMTATERYYEGESDEVIGMNDKRLYGERYHYMPFGEAIDAGILADYSVVLLAIRRSEAEDYRLLIEERMFVEPDLESTHEDLTAEDLATAVALRKACQKYKLTHAVSFHSRNRQAMDFVELQKALNGAGLSAPLKTFRVSSDISTGKRREQLKGFAEAKRALISNARCLTEGVDVPGIDLVLFAQPRQSKVDIVQAVGRALRIPSDQPNKRGYVLVPVLIDDDEDDIENVVRGTGFENLVSVLKAMATVDEDITDRIEVVVSRTPTRNSRGSNNGAEGEDLLPETVHLERFANSLRLCAWDRLEGLRRTRLSNEQILEWADKHYARAGHWPKVTSGTIHGDTSETWTNVNQALVKGLRGLSGSSSLANLLEQRRAVRNQKALPSLNESEILDWAKDHNQLTGMWPSRKSGVILAEPTETWASIDAALMQGRRDLQGGSSLSKLLNQSLGVRSKGNLPPLTEDLILAWAKAYMKREKRWPTQSSGQIPEARGETWSGVHQALRKGHRGLAGGSSLAIFLQRKTGKRNKGKLEPLCLDKIISWAKNFYSREGKWPKQKSGNVFEAPDETWTGIDHALAKGQRGLLGGSTLAKLLDDELGVRNIKSLSPLCEERILVWIDEHHERTGRWPISSSGEVSTAPEEKWINVNMALIKGLRSLPGGSSLAKLIAEHRDKRNARMNQ